MKEDYYSRIEKRIGLFPPLPTSVTEVMRVVNDPESSAKDLTQAILPDQSLCVTVLKYKRFPTLIQLADALAYLSCREEDIKR